MSPRLADLEELLLTVRDRDSRRYAAEALSAYQGGALRAAIVSTWIAASYDIIAKIREPAERGNGQAATFRDDLEDKIKQHENEAGGKPGPLLEIERQLLEEARDKFEFISAEEHRDLSRLVADRHRCAHPAFTSSRRLFDPSPELVRLHLVNTFNHLLRVAPVVGKEAIEDVRDLIIQQSFPSTQPEATQLLGQHSLKRMSPAARGTIVKVFIKKLLKDEAVLAQEDPTLVGKERSIGLLLQAVRHFDPTAYEAAAEEQLAKSLANADDSTLLLALRLLDIDDQTWTWIPEPARTRVESLIEQLEQEVQGQAGLLRGYGADQLHPALNSVFGKLSPDDRYELLRHCPRPELLNESVELLETYAVFTNEWAKAEAVIKNILIPLAAHLKNETIKDVAARMTENYRVPEAFETRTLLAELFQQAPQTHAGGADDWRAILQLVKKHNKKGGWPLEQAMQQANLLADSEDED